MKFERRTHRLYYDDFYLRQAEATVVKAGTDWIELDRTVAYPEGGGQEADQGLILTADGRRFRFVGAKKMYGHLPGLPEFSGVLVGGVVWHLIHPEDQAGLAHLQGGTSVTVSIDVERRARMSLSHTASHLLYIGVGRHRPDAVDSTLGCHIRTDGARFDFRVDERISTDDVARIQATANALVERGLPISFSAHAAEPDARRWHCDEHVIPCGGTHLDHTALVGPLEVRRKSMGAGKERLSCEFSAAVFDTRRYHD